eukprot:4952275-Ditylum_brightwellii.AAC.1
MKQFTSVSVLSATITIIVIALTIRLDGPMMEYLDDLDLDPEIVIVKEIPSPTKEEIATATINVMMTFPIEITACIRIWNGFRMTIIAYPIVPLVEAMQVLAGNLHRQSHKTIRMIVWIKAVTFLLSFF